MAESTASSTLSPPLAKLIEKLPANDYDQATDVLEEILKSGESAIRAIVQATGQEFGDPNGVQPKLALHGLVHHASRPGAGKQRKLVATVLAAELAAKHSDDLKAFLCRQLQLCGGDAEMPALASQLSNPALCDTAVEALSAIGTPKAVTALRKALPGSTGAGRIALTKALGKFADAASAADIRKDIAATNRSLRHSAWFALGNIGDKESLEALAKAALESGSDYERGQALEAYLDLARKQGGAAGEKVCRTLLAKLGKSSPVHLRLAVFAALADTAGVRAVDELLTAMDSQDLKLRHHAAWTAVRLAGKLDPAAADGLLKKVLDATTEESVRRRAESLLADQQAG